MIEQHKSTLPNRLVAAESYLADKSPGDVASLQHFYQKLGRQATDALRKIDGQDVHFTTLTAVVMTREPNRAALILRENEADFDDKKYRLFLHPIGGYTVEYKIIETPKFHPDEGPRAGTDSHAFFLAEACSENIIPQFRRGTLRLGSSALFSGTWTINDKEMNLEDTSYIDFDRIEALRRAKAVITASRPELQSALTMTTLAQSS